MPDFLDLHAGASLLRHVDFVSALICLLIFAGLLVYFDAFCRAMAPRGGTLEWIAMYDRAPLSFGGLFSRYGRRDYVPMLVFSALSAGLIAFGAVRIARGGSIAPASILLEPDSLLRGLGGCALFSGLSLLPCYALLRRLSGRTDAAALSTALFAVQGLLNTALFIGLTVLFLAVFRWGVRGYVLSTTAANLLTAHT